MTVTSLFGYKVERVTVELEGLAPFEASFVTDEPPFQYAPRLNLQQVSCEIAEQQAAAKDRKIKAATVALERAEREVGRATEMMLNHARDRGGRSSCRMCVERIRRAVQRLALAEAALEEAKRA